VVPAAGSFVDVIMCSCFVAAADEGDAVLAGGKKIAWDLDVLRSAAAIDQILIEFPVYEESVLYPVCRLDVWKKVSVALSRI